ncbi:D-aminoacyl-tRNA deacylase [uncultured Jatrophihabitans sp.]|uniref:D-aminoacyl-tRNA deacylase n=1 Tax=uncultured Jatrophihabitans sp. TaxID=1610747 RepID=UPI0035CA76E1
MRVLVQRVAEAWVKVGGEEVARIGPGLLALIGVTHGDGPAQAAALARKTHALRALRDERSVADVPGASILVVSQFTLYGDTRKGRRPSWSAAAPGRLAEPVVAAFVDELRTLNTPVHTGIFGADMQVGLINDGPFTVSLEL